MKYFFLTFLVGLIYPLFAQQDSTNAVGLDGYIETYYLYDAGIPSDHTRPGYIYSHNRHNEFSLNIGFIRAFLKNTRYRANLALMTGTYANTNLAAEPSTLRNIYEANGGFRISKQKQLWLDAGIFGSHIGYESAIGKDCWTMTRSLTADNTPYYESGVKLSYTSDSERWLLSALLLNGWQRIQRVDGNNVLCGGTQITYKAGDKLLLNSSTFAGSGQLDSTMKMRYFLNFYAIWQIHPALSLLGGFDYGVQQKERYSSYVSWCSSSVLVKVSPFEKVSFTGRYENYFDRNGVVIASINPNGFNVHSTSLNTDIQIAKNILWRIECKGYFSEDKVLVQRNTISNSTWVCGSALCATIN